MLERLSRHGPAPGGAGGDGRDVARGRRRRRRHAQHLGQQPSASLARARARRSARPRGGADLHLGLCRQRRGAVDPGARIAGHGGVLRRLQPRLDDRRHPQQPRREAHLPPQRPGRSRAAARARARRAAKARLLRVGLFDGRRHRADRRIVRRRRPLRRDDLSRRGARGRALRSARRRHCRARRRHAPPDGDPGHARQGLRHDRRLCRGLGGARRFPAQPRAGLHLHDLIAAGARRRRARRNPPSEAEPSRARAPPGARGHG